MRIVAGAQRGRVLVAPKGHSTRPTADRTRQALFNVLEHAPWGRLVLGARVIDLFAGSGALGLEALSRGAVFCLFVENDGAAREAIAANLAALRVTDRARVLAADAARLSQMTDHPFDLAFLDPPYNRGLAEASLPTLAAHLAAAALVTVERGADERPLAVNGYELLDERRWGAAKVAFLKRT
ncbi:MAG TPA: 16S rRNA (guanine(966)-N(2))-methyltransferase RsmD [Caulobacteraceae bacterium]|jgi:16S rRNA (guanine966-N2)-methyltransferase